MSAWLGLVILVCVSIKCLASESNAAPLAFTTALTDLDEPIASFSIPFLPAEESRISGAVRNRETE